MATLVEIFALVKLYKYKYNTDTTQTISLELYCVLFDYQIVQEVRGSFLNFESRRHRNCPHTTAEVYRAAASVAVVVEMQDGGQKVNAAKQGSNSRS